MSDMFDKENVVDVDFTKTAKRVRKVLPVAVIVIFVIYALLTSFYTINSGENAVVLRIGKVHKVEKDDGLHMKFPIVDKIEIVNVEKIYNMEYGFATSVPGSEDREAVYEDRFEEATVIVDGDNDNASIALIELIINYRISDPEAYLFNVSDIEGTLRLALEDSVRSSVQTLTIDEAKINKDLINIPTLDTLQKKMNDYEAGIEITKVATQNVSFLDAVEEVYQKKENANQYRQAREEDAEQYQNTEIPKAEAEAAKMIAEAQMYSVQTIAGAKAGIAEYDALYEEYKNNNEIVKEKYYIEAMKEFISNNEIVVDTTVDGDIYKFYNIDEADNVKKEITVE